MVLNLAGILKQSFAIANVQAKAYTEAQMSSTVSITRRVNPVFDPTTGALTDPNSVVYTGMAWVSEVQGAQQMVLGEEVEFYATVTIRLPESAPPIFVDDVVIVTATLEVDTVNRPFRVVNSENGGDFAVDQTLTCVGVTHSRTQSYS